MKKTITYFSFFIIITLAYGSIKYFFETRFYNTYSEKNINEFSLNPPSEKYNYPYKNTKQFYIDEFRGFVRGFFFLNPNRFLKNKVDYQFIISENDKKFFDSILKIASKRGKMTDDLKSYRRVQLINKDTLQDVKIKYHGSSVFPHYFNKPSLRLRLSNELAEYNLISGIEMNYRNIFFNTIGLKNNLIAEGPGEIKSIRFNGFTFDTYKYKRLDSLVISDRFKKNLIFEFKNFSNFYQHSDDQDILFYNNEKNVIINNIKEEEKFNRFKNLLTSGVNYNENEIDYYGKFLSLIYLFDNVHMITGDNDTWFICEEGNFPLFRNEINIGTYNPVRKNDFDAFIFKEYETIYKREILSFHKYKRLLIDPNIRNKRNSNFNKLLNEKTQILSLFDSIYFSNENKHKMFNKDFFLMKKTYEATRENLQNNFITIKNYLEIDKIYFAKIKDTLFFSSKGYVPFQIFYDKKLIGEFESRAFQLESNQINSRFIENKIQFSGDTEKLIFINKITSDTIKNLSESKIKFNFD
jgi:hypothetical protein